MDLQIEIIVGVAVLLFVVAGLGLVVSRRRRTEGVADEIAAARTSGTDLSTRLAKSRSNLGGGLRNAFGRGRVDADLWQSLEEALIGADVGVDTSTSIVERVRQTEPTIVTDARERLRAEVRRALGERDRGLRLDGSPAVVMVVGVNGAGKTTSIAKIAAHLRTEGHSTLLGAADTFRAAADTQLKTWADRVGVEMVSGQPGSDPASVAYDAMAAAKARGRDVVIIDTAGRLQSKKNLMDELSKMRRVLERDGGQVSEVLLVLDATAGHNGVAQARQFLETAGVTGIVLTKLDGTAKGGIVVAIEHELGIPVKFIGVGEGIEDLIPFDPDSFVEALMADA